MSGSQLDEEEEWAHITEPKQRKRLQNRVSQRKHRQRKREASNTNQAYIPVPVPLHSPSPATYNIDADPFGQWYDVSSHPGSHPYREARGPSQPQSQSHVPMTPDDAVILRAFDAAPSSSLWSPPLQPMVDSSSGSKTALSSLTGASLSGMLPPSPASVDHRAHAALAGLPAHVHWPPVPAGGGITCLHCGCSGRTGASAGTGGDGDGEVDPLYVVIVPRSQLSGSMPGEVGFGDAGLV